MGEMERRFWAKVQKTDACWLWTAAIGTNGYGAFGISAGVVRSAHRVAWLIEYGSMPPRNVDIDHICHVRRCVRPDHLRLTSRKQNNEHRVAPNSNGKSGVRGVYWHKSANKWATCIRHNGRSIHVGLFETLGAAEAAAIKARLELFTHNDMDRTA